MLLECWRNLGIEKKDAAFTNLLRKALAICRRGGICLDAAPSPKERFRRRASGGQLEPRSAYITFSIGAAFYRGVMRRLPAGYALSRAEIAFGAEGRVLGYPFEIRISVEERCAIVDRGGSYQKVRDH